MGIAYRLYSGAQVLWLFLVIGVVVALYAGVAESVVAPSQLPVSDATVVAVAAGVAVGGFVVFGYLRVRSWRGIGRRAGLTPDESTYGGLSRFRRKSPGPHRRARAPDLVGTVDGRSVRVTTYRTKGSSGEGGSSGKTWTIVRAEVDEPVGVGTYIGLRSEDLDFPVSDAVPESVRLVPVDEEFSVLGPDATAFAEQVLSGRVRTLLRDADYPDGVTVGDLTDSLLEAVPDEMESMLSLVSGGQLEAKLRNHPANDASAVAISTRGLCLDAMAIQRQAETVVAVADEIERTRAEPQPA